eukprot:2333953-Prymnesium_polylepis.7
MTSVAPSVLRHLAEARQRMLVQELATRSSPQKRVPRRSHLSPQQASEESGGTGRHGLHGLSFPAREFESGGPHRSDSAMSSIMPWPSASEYSKATSRLRTRDATSEVRPRSSTLFVSSSRDAPSYTRDCFTTTPFHASSRIRSQRNRDSPSSSAGG